MKTERILNNVIIRNAAGILALMLAHLLADHANIVNRTGLNRYAPYIFLLTMYGWIVFHNRILFEKLFLQNRKRAYFGWTLLAMVLSSLNMHYILKTGFKVNYTIPHILSFWVYTVAGLGVHVTWRYLWHMERGLSRPEEPAKESGKEVVGEFSCSVDGVRHNIPHQEIHYVESLENYVRIITAANKPMIVRLSLKETEQRLPVPPFIRISRSCIVNTQHIKIINSDTVTVHGKELKVGKVFKKYVEKFLSHN